MRWSHAFSYGANNKINFSNSELLQLVGKNGHGKSSIALILEEVLYNKNSKGIKKANILNRYSGAKTYTIELDFTKDGDQYTIKTTRGSTQTVKLTKNEEDISEHTATATYKLIEEIIGYDHKAFTQIVYQSSAFSLEFLTATDTNRKKFLIDLLRLTKYSEALDHYKALAKDIQDELSTLETKLKLTDSVITKYKDADLSIKPLVDVPEADSSLRSRLAELEEQLRTIDSTNDKIVKNNKYKEILGTINIAEIPETPPNMSPLMIRESELEKRIAVLNKAAAGVVMTVCPSCKQPVDNSHKLQMINEAKEELATLKPQLAEIRAEIDRVNALTTKYQSALRAQSEWEKYYSLVDKSMSSELLNKAEIEAEISELKKQIQQESAKIASAVSDNAKASSHNAKVEVIKTQLATAFEESDVLNMEKFEKSARMSTVGILVKTFSTTGLVAYKIECLVKDLEEITNKYLQDMSDGRFQLSFKISTSDKLDVIITDNGADIDIAALSNGELARVNVSTLLAIRKLMQTLSSSRINLLILDETVESLDVDGKEKLVEVLLNEEFLNTVLVSHGFTHPLLEKLSIVKENGISRIE